MTYPRGPYDELKTHEEIMRIQRDPYPGVRNPLNLGYTGVVSALSRLQGFHMGRDAAPEHMHACELGLLKKFNLLSINFKATDCSIRI